MQDLYLICCEDLSDKEKKFVDDFCKLFSLWKDKYEDEINRLKDEIKWYQKQIDKISR